MKNNAQFRFNGFKTELLYSQIGGAPTYLVATLYFKGLILKKGQKIALVLNDDFSVLDVHQFKITGYK